MESCAAADLAIKRKKSEYSACNFIICKAISTFSRPFSLLEQLRNNICTMQLQWRVKLTCQTVRKHQITIEAQLVK